MLRAVFSPKLALVLFTLFLVGGIVLFAALGIFAPVPEGAPVVAAPPTVEGARPAGAVSVAGGPDSAEALFVNKGCVSCHVVAGIQGAVGNIGPDLNGLAGREQIAGMLPMSQDNLRLWLKNPSEVKPGTAMPNLNLSAEDIDVLSSFLMTLK